MNWRLKKARIRDFYIRPVLKWLDNLCRGFKYRKYKKGEVVRFIGLPCPRTKEADLDNHRHFKIYERDRFRVLVGTKCCQCWLPLEDVERV